MFRELQVATLGNESVADGDDIPYYIPYGIAGLVGLGLIFALLQYGHYMFCKLVCGREDPVDVEELLSGLTKEQRKEVLRILVQNRTSAGTGLSVHYPSLQQRFQNGSNENDKKESSCATKEQPNDRKVESQATINIVQETDMKAEDKTLPSSETLLEGATGETKEKSKPDIEEGLVEKKVESENDEQAFMVDDSQTSKKSSESLCQEEKDSLVHPDGDESDEEEDKQVCPICLGSFEDNDPIFQSENCSHKFHADCILEWLGTKDHNDCPVCRAEIIKQEEMVSAALKVVKRDIEAGIGGEKAKRSWAQILLGF